MQAESHAPSNKVHDKISYTSFYRVNSRRPTTIGNRVSRKGSRVRIPPSPLNTISVFKGGGRMAAFGFLYSIIASFPVRIGNEMVI